MQYIRYLIFLPKRKLVEFFTPNNLVKFFTPKHVDVLLYEISVQSHNFQPLAKIELEIKKMATSREISYEAFSNGEKIHRSILYKMKLLPLQFGYSKSPIIGGSFTHPEYRGLRIYPHMLSYIINDLRESESADSVKIIVATHNYPSIRGIEMANFRYVTRLKGTRIGPFLINHSDHRKSGSN